MTRGSMDLSNNSGLIKFLDDNRDSYEERVSFTCHQNASYVNLIALFPLVPQSRRKSMANRSLATSSVTFYLCDIFGICSWHQDTPSSFPLLTLREILSTNARYFIYLDYTRVNLAVKLARSLLRHLRC